MPFGLKTAHLQTLKSIFDQYLFPLFPNAQVYIFGSRARGDHKPYSDIDLLIENEDRIDAKILAKLRAELEDSNLPYKADLMLLQDLAASYRKNINKDKKLLFS